MNPVLTFFHERNPGREPPHHWQAEVAGRDLSLDCYSAAPLADPPDFFGRSFGQVDEFQSFCDQLREALASGGGGLLVTTADLGTRLAVEIEAIRPTAPGAYTPPGTAFRIDPEEGLDEHSLLEPKTELALPAGSHLILPVDAEAETRFRSFRTDYLAWFPRDFEPLMLGVIRKPSLDLLDARVARLEQILLDIAEGGSRESRNLFAWFDRFRAKNAGSAEPPTRTPERSEGFRPTWKSLWIPVLVTGLLTAPIGYFVGRGRDSVPAAAGPGLAPAAPGAKSSAAAPEGGPVDTKDGIGTAGAPPAGPTEAAGEKPAADPADELAASLQDLMALLAQEGSPKPDAAIANLWDSHFKTLPERANLGRDSLEKLYARPEFLWGMLKLPALLARSGSPKEKAGPKTVPGDPGKITAMAADYKALLSKPSGLLAEASIPPLLADLVCRLAALDGKPDVQASPFFDRGTKTEKIFTRQPCPSSLSLHAEAQGEAVRLMAEALRKRLASGAP